MRGIYYVAFCYACDKTWRWNADDDRISHRDLNIAFDQHAALGGGHQVGMLTQAEYVAHLEQQKFGEYVRRRIAAEEVYPYELPAFVWIGKR